jgi:S-(hydroxymethyl)glutathione synthase
MREYARRLRHADKAAAHLFGSNASDEARVDKQAVEMAGIRSRLRELELEPYDCLSPALMGAFAPHASRTKAA